MNTAKFYGGTLLLNYIIYSHVVHQPESQRVRNHHGESLDSER